MTRGLRKYQRYALAVDVQGLSVPLGRETSAVARSGFCASPPSNDCVRTILMVPQNLKSAEELEADREAQSAKLQDLLRRQTPRDLAAEQESMKALV